MTKSIVLAVDDDPIQIEIIKTAASKLKYPSIEVVGALNVTDALEILDHRPVDMVFTDQRLPDGTAYEVVQRSITLNPMVPIVVMTAFESVEDAVGLMKRGARDYLVKPLRPQEIQRILITSLEKRHQMQEVHDVLTVDDAVANGQTNRPPIPEIGNTTSESMRRALSLAGRAAGTESSVLIHGESGTGKEVMARLVHANSTRSGGPFVPVNIAAIPEALVESELFGHKKGAYTGAVNDRDGYFQRAKGGTLFIDELGDIPLHTQVKLLRAIQFREVYPLGSETPVKLDVRIITATNHNLETLIQSGEFREDLFYRLNVINIEIPPLRDRQSDIPLLTETFITRFARLNKRNIAGISQRALNYLIRYRFPGNIRELENIIERAVVLTEGPLIVEADLPPFVIDEDDPKVNVFQLVDPLPDDGVSLDDQIHMLERRLIDSALQKAGGDQSRAASLLRITERRLRGRINRLNIVDHYQ